MDKTFYFDKLYPLQDQVLKILQGVETGFYLTGGTAASRGYLHHRLSDDLDSSSTTIAGSFSGRSAGSRH